MKCLNNNKRIFFLNKWLYSGVVMMVLTLGACKTDLLDTSPYGSLSSNNMWTSDNLTDLGVAGVYQALRLGIGTSNKDLYQMDRFVTSQYRDNDALLTGSATPNNGMFSEIWKDMYEGIHRANTAIVSIRDISPSEPDKKARLIAEVKFLRAYYYFRLNQVFKGVPLYLEPVAVDELNKVRETEQKIWDIIIDDLTDCINEENLPLKYNSGNTNFGHVTKSAAYALRGKAYMYTMQWDLAERDFIEVENAGHTLFDDYQALFLEANEQSDEMIFSIQNLPVENFGTNTQFLCGFRSSFGSCWTTYNISPDLVEIYENADGSPFNWDDVIPGYSAKTPQQREVYFLRNNLTEAEIAAAASRGADMSVYLPNGNEERIKMAYADRDPRLKANVITPYETYLGREIEGADRVFTSRWPFRTELLPTIDLLTDTRNLFYYLHRKFVYTGSHQLPSRTAGGIDFPIIRYGDVVLMRAEAVNEQNRTDDAVTLVNKIRTRAGVGLLNSSPETTVAGQSDMRKRIQKERRRELVNEGVSYFDELRWRTLKETVFYEGNGVKQVWGGIVIPYLWKGDELYSWAIPLAERQRNPSLTQNEGWIE